MTRLLLPLLALLAACAGPAEHPSAPPSTEAAQLASDSEPAASEAGWRELPTRGGTYRIAWRPSPPPIPLNESFELEVRVRDAAGAPVDGAEVVVRGFMPGHGHGMLRDPRAEAVGDGLYRVRGMLLHMTGHWELTLDAIIDGAAHSCSFELELE